MDKSLDGLHHIRNAEDSDQQLQVIGEDMKAHLGPYALQPLAQERRRPYRRGKQLCHRFQRLLPS